jgi:hypothetical protein
VRLTTLPLCLLPRSTTPLLTPQAALKAIAGQQATGLAVLDKAQAVVNAVKVSQVGAGCFHPLAHAA